MVQRAGIAQINPTVGDITANLEKMKHFVSLARRAAVDLLILPELSVVGYPPMDILEKEGFVADSLRAVEELAQCDPAMGVIVGFVRKNPNWVADLELMMKIKEKAEIQALSKFGFEYLTSDYLPSKISTADWI